MSAPFDCTSRLIFSWFPECQTITNQAIFKIQSGVGNLFRDYLNGQGFVEIHSPKLQGAATESGASVFRVSYFKCESEVNLEETLVVANSTS